MEYIRLQAKNNFPKLRRLATKVMNLLLLIINELKRLLFR